MSKCNSLENINLQFRDIMGKMGLDEDKQKKLAVKMDLAKKIKTIISMQSLEERKRKIKEYLERIEKANSLMSLLSLHSSIEDGSKTLFTIFMSSRGPEIVLKALQGECVYAVLEFIEMVLHKYDCEMPGIIEGMLEKFVREKFYSPSFFRILEGRVRKGEYEILFRSTSPFGCVCSTYISLLVGVMREGDYGLVEALLETERKEYMEYILRMYSSSKVVDSVERKEDCKVSSRVDGRVGVSGGLPCRSERLFEVIRMAEEKKMVDVVTSAIESLVLGKKHVQKDVQDEIVEKVKDVKIQQKGDVEEKVDVQQKVDTTKDDTTVHDTTKQHTQRDGRKKIVKKIVKRARKNYVQIKWTRIPKEGSIFEDLPPGVEFTEKDLEPFVRVETKETKRETKKMVSLFPEKKNYALNIALSRVKEKDEDLKRRILHLEDCGENLVKQLLLYFPTEEEVEALRGLSTPTGRAESFFLAALGEIDALRDALSILHFRILLKGIPILSFSTLSHYYSTLLSSTSLKKILAFILSLGNSLNPTKTEAYSLLSLGLVLENRTVLGLLKEKIDLKPFLDDFKILYEVQRISFENLQGDIHHLTLHYQKIERIECDVREEYMRVEEEYRGVLGLHTKAQEYLKEKIDEEFNRQFFRIYQHLGG